MDVRCERCNTEYEFDDALVSGRGTTVKCTSCGHKFRIRRADGDFSEDYWNVRTRDDKTLVFTSLRELQRAIQTRGVARDDMLSRGGLPPKPIGQIPELAAFFDREASREAPPAPRRASVPPPPPPGAVSRSLSPPRQRQSTRPDFPPPPAPFTAFKQTLPGTGLDEGSPGSPTPGDVRSRMGSIRPSDAPPTDREEAAPRFEEGAFRAPRTPEDLLTKTQPFMPIVTLPESTTHGPPPAAGGTARPPVDGFAAPPPASRPRSAPPVPAAGRPPSLPPPVPKRPSRPSEPAAPRAASTPPPLPAASRTPAPPAAVSEPPRAPRDTSPPRSASRASIPEAPPPSSDRRRPVGGYVVAAVVALGVAGVGMFWMQKYGVGKPAKVEVAAPVDPRVGAFLTAGEQALAAGNLEVAKESFDKASALAERDPRVLVDGARLAATRADRAWLKTRLVPTTDADDLRVARGELAELAPAASRAADAALAVAPNDPAALRAKVDALRIAGDLVGARALVARSSAIGAEAEGAYVLAALDLAEPSPSWPAVLERLRTASAVEVGPGRARAALVHALALSGDVTGAKAELDRLATMPRPTPLLPLLRAEVARSKPAAAAVDAGAATAAVETKAADAHGGGGGGGSPGLSSDPRVLVAQADAARAKNDFEKARGLYSAALEKSPSDSEALHGLAAIAHAQHDLTNARNGYRRVLAINPTYLPALIGLGDAEWEAGDRAAAIRAYKEISDRFPEGAYPARVKQRIDSGGSAPPASTGSSEGQGETP